MYAIDYPWKFINHEMLRFARLLTASEKLGTRLKLAKSIFDLTSSRFISHLYSFHFLRDRLPQPAYRTWAEGRSQSALNQSITVKAMLLTTGRFKDSEILVRTCAIPRSFRKHVFLELCIDKRRLYLDSWGRDWKVPYGYHYGEYEVKPFNMPKIRGRYDENYCTANGIRLYIKGTKLEKLEAELQ